MKEQKQICNNLVHSNMNLLSRFTFLAFSFLLLNFSVFAQERSKKIETIDGKKYYMHTIEKGQTLFNIAKLYEVEKNDIILENPGVIDGIKENSTLKIPYNKVKTVKSANTTINSGNNIIHTVEKGQTLYAISKLYNVKTDEIIAHNPEASSGLKQGQTLIIPKKASAPITIGSPDKKAAIVLETKPKEVLESKSEIVKKEFDSPAMEPKAIGDKMNIGLLLPLFLNQNDSAIISNDKEIYSKTLVGLQFYQGFMCAVDTIKKTGLNANIYTYDTEMEIANTEHILKKPELKEMNLIVGPFYTSSAQLTSSFCKTNGIYFVSPFSPSNKVLLGNPNSYKINPSAQSQVNEIINYVKKTYEKENIFLVTYDESKEKAVIDYYKEIYISAGFKDSLKVINFKKQGYKAIETAYKTNSKNIMLFSISDQAGITEFFNKIKSAEKDLPEVVIFGLESWNNYDNLEYDNLQKFNVIIPNNTYIDYSSFEVQNFIKYFREKYKTEPDKYAFMGYDVATNFLKGLQNKNISKEFMGLNSNFKFEVAGFESGYENKAVNLIKIEDLKAIKIN